jgi:hypothetical protein
VAWLMEYRFIYPVYTYDGSEEEGHAGKASAEGRINGNGWIGLDKTKVMKIQSSIGRLPR